MEVENPKLVIITNDSDYLQMNDNTTVIQNMQFKDLSLRIKNSPVIELNFKIIYGDKSDNIQKIQTGLNKENALILAMKPEKERYEYLEKHNLTQKYLINKTLINLSCIPDNLMNAFYDKYNIIINKK